MTRDLVERLTLLTYGAPVHLNRLALNMEQVEDQQPPPNPAKVTDSRFIEYQSKYGDESWELDALQPAYLAGLVRDAVDGVIDTRLWNKKAREIENIKERLQTTATKFDMVEEDDL